ncbi:MAG TPA: FHA domain-containing protein [Polyangiaceae bacterium]|nr:FHA domain-containing protein [Polyangiaceae bacterium]
MAQLREMNGVRAIVLQPEHLVGRSPQCTLQLVPGYVSAQHALIRWNGNSWRLLDRGSRNGTHLNGKLIEPGRDVALEQGAVIAFGHPNERWSLVDVSAPQPGVVCLDTGAYLPAVDGVIGLPSADNPACVLYQRGVDGAWLLELPNQSTLPIQDNETFQFADAQWQFCCPRAFNSTSAANLETDLLESVLVFRVSSDEEFVELSLQYANRVLMLGTRQHNFLLLTLARARLADAARELPEAECGWIYKEQLAQGLLVTSQQVDGEVFRIRRHFGHHGVPQAAVIIERRPGTTQLRIGMSRLQIIKT